VSQFDDFAGLVLVALVHLGQCNPQREIGVVALADSTDCFRNFWNCFLQRLGLGHFLVWEWSVGRPLASWGICGLLRLLGCFGQ
jgi:hypothetical protein